MDDLRGNVIYSIGRCICHVPDACRDCAYDAGHPYNECVELLLKDALSLLKAQEPRVMTLEEVLSFDSAIYMDDPLNIITCLKALYCHEVGRGTYDHGYTFVDSDGDRIFYPAKGFNKTWRCWSSRPTDEQREETPWE